MPRALVTGTGGFIGGHLARRLVADDLQLRTVSAAPAPVASIDHHQCLLAQVTDAHLQALLTDVDVCYHVAGMAHHAAQQDPDGRALHAFNVELTVRLYQAAQRAGVGRFVWLSSSKVLGDRSSGPLPIDARYAATDPYGQSKVAAERALLAAQSPATRVLIVRPPLVYGPGVGANFRSLLQAALGRWPLPLAAATAPRSMIGIDNLCAALARCAQAPAGTYQVSDPAPVTVAQLLREIACAAGTRARLWYLPPTMLRLALALTGRSAIYQRLFWPLELDTADSERRLQWQPTLSTSAQLQETVAWFCNQR